MNCYQILVRDGAIEMFRREGLEEINLLKTSEVTCLVVMENSMGLSVLKISRRSLAHEYRLQCNLDPKYVTPIIGKGRIHRFKYIVTKHFAKGDLKQHLNYQAVDEHSAKCLFIQLVEIVGYLHGNNIAHLDIKPENFLVGDDLNLKITDFGHAKNLVDSPYLSSRLSGSLKYLSPERFCSKPFDGYKADIYALGVSLFHLLTTTYPFSKASVECSSFMKFSATRICHLAFMEKLSKETLNVKTPFWSEELADLLNMLLDPVPLSRPSISEIKHHSWLR